MPPKRSASKQSTLNGVAKRKSSPYRGSPDRNGNSKSQKTTGWMDLGKGLYVFAPEVVEGRKKVSSTCLISMVDVSMKRCEGVCIPLPRTGGRTPGGLAKNWVWLVVPFPVCQTW